MKYRIQKIFLVRILLLAVPVFVLISVPFSQYRNQKFFAFTAQANTNSQITSQIISETYHVEMKSPSKLIPLSQSAIKQIPEISVLPKIIRHEKNVKIIAEQKNTDSSIKHKTKKLHKTTRKISEVGKIDKRKEIGSLESTLANLQNKEKNTYSLLKENSKESIRLIDTLDVYTLSAYANYLRLPRMSLSLSATSISDSIKIQALQDIINEASLRFALNPALITAVIKVESNFAPNALSPKGAQGLMQIMPQTQVYLGVLNPYDAKMSIMAGSAYLREQLDRFGTEELALAAYNAGPYNVIKYKGVPPFSETKNYINKVLAYKNKISF